MHSKLLTSARKERDRERTSSNGSSEVAANIKPRGRERKRRSQSQKRRAEKRQSPARSICEGRKFVECTSCSSCSSSDLSALSVSVSPVLSYVLSVYVCVTHHVDMNWTKAWRKDKWLTCNSSNSIPFCLFFLDRLCRPLVLALLADPQHPNRPNTRVTIDKVQIQATEQKAKKTNTTESTRRQSWRVRERES